MSLRHLLVVAWESPRQKVYKFHPKSIYLFFDTYIPFARELYKFRQQQTERDKLRLPQTLSQILPQILPNFGTNQSQSELIGLIPINSDKFR